MAATAVVAQTVDTSQAQQDVPKTFARQKHLKTYHFKRTYEHGFGNSMDARGYTETTTGGFATAYMIDDGFHYIPYANMACAMTTNDFVEVFSNAQAVRVDKLGFKVEHFHINKVTATPLGGITQMSAVSAPEPMVEVFTDHTHQYDNNVEVRPPTAAIPLQTMGVPPALVPNNGMQNQTMTSWTQGRLLRSVWVANNATTAGSDKAWNPDLMLSQIPTSGTADQFSIRDIKNEEGYEMMTQQQFGNMSHEWTNPNQHEWYPCRMPRQSTDWAYQSGLQAAIPATIPTSRQRVLLGSAQPQSDGSANPRGTNLPNFKHNIWQPVDLEVAVPSANTNIPKDVYVKIARDFTSEGPIEYDGKVLITYNCSITVEPQHGGFNFTGQVGSYGTGVDTAYFGTSYTLGLARRYSSWGIPNLNSVAPLAPLAYGDIYQPATYGGSFTRKRRLLDMAQTADQQDDNAASKRAATTDNITTAAE